MKLQIGVYGQPRILAAKKKRPAGWANASSRLCLSSTARCPHARSGRYRAVGKRCQPSREPSRPRLQWCASIKHSGILCLASSIFFAESALRVCSSVCVPASEEPSFRPSARQLPVTLPPVARRCATRANQAEPKKSTVRLFGPKLCTWMLHSWPLCTVCTSPCLPEPSLEKKIPCADRH